MSYVTENTRVFKKRIINTNSTTENAMSYSIFPTLLHFGLRRAY